MDATVQLLTGATIYKVTRRGLWLDLETDKGRVILGTPQAQIDPLLCFKCGESRLTEIIETAGRKVGACKVCTHTWKLDGR